MNRQESLAAVMPRMARLLIGLFALSSLTASAEPILAPDWDAKQAGDRVLQGLIPITAPHVKGAHDAGMVIARDRAFIVAEVNDQRAGEGASWPEIYSAMSIVDLATMTVEQIIPFARGEQVFENETLPVGACFVPRIVQMDGKTWTPNVHRDFVPDGTSAKPTFDRFDGVYYLGWQEATRIGGVARSVFNVDVSRGGKAWERKYRFETTKSFQYPTFCEHQGTIYVAVTQGDHSGSRKERIMFGRLESVPTGRSYSQ